MACSNHKATSHLSNANFAKEGHSMSFEVSTSCIEDNRRINKLINNLKDGEINN